MKAVDESRAVQGSISPLTLTVSAYIAEAVRRPIPEEATEATKQHLLDTLAAMISGSTLLPGVKAIQYVKTLGGTEEACVPGSQIVTNALNAALRPDDSELLLACELPGLREVGVLGELMPLAEQRLDMLLRQVNMMR